MAEPGRCEPVIFSLLLCLTIGAGCGRSARPVTASTEPSVLRIGLGQFQAEDPQAGLRQIPQLLSAEAS